MSTRLSELQAEILVSVLERYRHIEQHGNEFWRGEIAYWGVEWPPYQRTYQPNAAERAALSRALRRLEARGLVQRRNSVRGDRWQEEPSKHCTPVIRTTRAKLTDEGRTEAERLTNASNDVVNRLEIAA